MCMWLCGNCCWMVDMNMVISLFVCLLLLFFLVCYFGEWWLNCLFYVILVYCYGWLWFVNFIWIELSLFGNLCECVCCCGSVMNFRCLYSVCVCMLCVSMLSMILWLLLVGNVLVFSVLWNSVLKMLVLCWCLFVV